MRMEVCGCVWEDERWEKISNEGNLNRGVFISLF